MSSKRINSSQIGSITRILTKNKFGGAKRDIDDEINRFLDKFLLMQLPDVVKAAYTEHPEYFPKSRKVISYMVNNTNDDDDDECTCKIAYYYPDTTIPTTRDAKLDCVSSDIFVSLLNKRAAIQEQESQLGNAIQEQLEKLSTYKRIETHFPEAYALLTDDDEKSTLDLNEVRKLL